MSFVSFFFNDTATTEIYALSLHDALPISASGSPGTPPWCARWPAQATRWRPGATWMGCDGRCWRIDRKSTRLNSSHLVMSYAVFCLTRRKTRHAASSPLTLYHNRRLDLIF